MTATYIEATDQMLTVLQNVWTNEVTPLTTYTPALYWPGQKPGTTVDGSKFWGRVSLQDVLSTQATLSSEVKVSGSKRFTTVGVLVFQLWCPHSVPNSYATGRQIVEKVRNTYRGATTTTGIWYTNVRIRELPAEDVFHRFNVVAQYRYDDLG